MPALLCTLGSDCLSCSSARRYNFLPSGSDTVPVIVKRTTTRTFTRGNVVHQVSRVASVLLHLQVLVARICRCRRHAVGYNQASSAPLLACLHVPTAAPPPHRVPQISAHEVRRVVPTRMQPRCVCHGCI